MYTRQEAFDTTLDYFEGDQLAASTVVDKYLLKQAPEEYLENSPSMMHQRLAKEFHRIEKNYSHPLTLETIYRSLYGFKNIIPQGSPMFGIGNDQVLTSLSNCVVVASPEDSISSIVNTGRDLANLFKNRCGVGLDISTLRPENTPVNNSAGTTTGAWSFADLYSYICRKIGQNGRRGALMISMDVRHPDIFKFATMKKDLTQVTGANVSIKISDDFMEAVESDSNFILQWPVDSPAPKYTETIQARDLWNLIVETATTTAEPGLLMWNNILKYLPAQCYADVGFDTVSVNPCVTKDTWIQTSRGPQQVKDLIGCQSYLATVNGHSYGAKAFWSTGTKKVFEIATNKGYKLKLTGNHKLLVPTNNWVELNNLKEGSSICLGNQKGNTWKGHGTFEEGWLVGEILGDSGHNPNKYNSYLGFWGESKDDMKAIARGFVKNLTDTARSDCGMDKVAHKKVSIIRSKSLTNLTKKYLSSDGNKSILPAVEKASADFYKGFLRGIFDADGSCDTNHIKSGIVKLSQSNLHTLEVVQRMLQRLGIISTIYKRGEAGEKDFNDGYGPYKTKPKWDLYISRNNLIEYAKHIGFFEPEKTAKLSRLLGSYQRGPYKETFIDKIKSIKPVGYEEVFDTTVETAHEFDANGIRAHNCAEIMLSSYDSCRLITINLMGCVDGAYKEGAVFNFSRFENIVSQAMRLSDNLIDLELEKLTSILSKVDSPDEHTLWSKLHKACSDGRRTGLGTLALGDTLAALGLVYGSPESLVTVDKIYETLKVSAYTESVQLAKERGAFPVFDWEKEKDNLFIKSLPTQLQTDIATYGRRNISILTNAPTGSCAIAAQASSGIEPFFRLLYGRRKKINHNDHTTKADFVDELGDRWQYFDVFHHGVEAYWDANPTMPRSLEALPPEFLEATSDKIDWLSRIDVQATIQKHIDHSISSTINLPKNIPSAVVGELYMQAWKKGLKGVTVYVDGSRSGVLVTKEAVKTEGSIKREKFLPCEIHHPTIQGEQWIILIGKQDGKPYEVFGGKAQHLGIGKKQKAGVIEKHKHKGKTRYSLHYGETDLKINNIVEALVNSDHATLTRFVSMSLRHDVSIQYIVEQLQKNDNENLWSFGKVLARTLKRYIPNGTKQDKQCSKCQTNSLIYQEGCLNCTNCGYAKCG